MFLRLAVAAVLVVGSFALAQDPAQPAAAPLPGSSGPPPKPEVIKEVVDYLENGKDRGPALLDVIPCTKVDNTKGSPTQFQCIEVVSKPVAKNTTVFAWLQWYCPKDGKYEDVSIQFLHEGQVRNTVDVPVSGFGRTRGWRGANFNKVGKWTIKVMRGDKELGSATVDVAAQ
ncbi:MAG: hypothetical protein JNM17_16965 [Archangium sp.]|nr:hypothetical protein [Archangium sp.]